MLKVDINADLGEGYGRYSCGDDTAMLSIVSSVNVACGFHAGDPQIMGETFTLARRNGVAVGAHPGYADLWGFGRRRIPHSLTEIERLVAYQIGAAQAVAALSGHRLGYVKVHGALGNVADAERDVADAICRAIRGVDASLAYMAIANSEQVAASDALGIRTISEIYADRGYDDNGRIIPRGQPGALIHDPEEAADRVVRMVNTGSIITATGRSVPTPIDSVCVHGDTTHAVDTARLIRMRLEAAGVTIAPFVDVEPQPVSASVDTE